MSKTMVIAKFKLNNETLLEEWKVMSEKISADLQGQDGFISRDSVRGEDGLIYCLVKWESQSHQEQFMAQLMDRNDAESLAMMEAFGKIVNMESMSKEFYEVF